MSRTSITKHLFSTAAAGLVFVKLLSPATASTADHADEGGTNSRSRSIALTSHLPWLAPVGHRQPRQSDVPPYQGMSTEERRQRQLDHELDQKLIICRRC